MMSLAILTFLVGAVLGLRFRFYVLIPVTIVASLLVVGMGIVVGMSSWPILGAVVLTAALTQIGFLCGLSMRTVANGRELIEREYFASDLQEGGGFTPPAPGGLSSGDRARGSAAVAPPI